MHRHCPLRRGQPWTRAHPGIQRRLSRRSRAAAPITSRRIAPDRISTPSIAACAICSRIICKPDDFRRLEPHFDRLGALAGGRLDELARDRRQAPAGAAPARSFWPRRGLDRLSFVLSRDGKHRLRRFPVSRHEPSRRRARHGSPAAGGRQIRAAISVRAGRIRTDVPDQRHRHLDPSDPQIRQRRTEGISAAENAVRRRRRRCGRARSS